MDNFYKEIKDKLDNIPTPQFDENKINETAKKVISQAFPKNYFAKIILSTLVLGVFCLGYYIGNNQPAKNKSLSSIEISNPTTQIANAINNNNTFSHKDSLVDIKNKSKESVHRNSHKKANFNTSNINRPFITNETDIKFSNSNIIFGSTYQNNSDDYFKLNGLNSNGTTPTNLIQENNIESTPLESISKLEKSTIVAEENLEKIIENNVKDHIKIESLANKHSNLMVPQKHLISTKIILLPYNKKVLPTNKLIFVSNFDRTSFSSSLEFSMPIIKGFYTNVGLGYSSLYKQTFKNKNSYWKFFGSDFESDFDLPVSNNITEIKIKLQKLDLPIRAGYRRDLKYNFGLFAQASIIPSYLLNSINLYKIDGKISTLSKNKSSFIFSSSVDFGINYNLNSNLSFNIFGGLNSKIEKEKNHNHLKPQGGIMIGYSL